MKGQKLIAELVRATGLPKDLISKEVHLLIEREQKKSEDITMEDLRSIFTRYLQRTLLEAKEIF